MAIHQATPTLGQPESNAGKEDDAGHPAEDLVAAAIFVVMGIGAFVMALDYRTGTMHRMGPGIFPLLVSGLMVILGAALAVQALVARRLRRAAGAEAETGVVPDFAAVRALILTMVSLLVFALLIRAAGMMIAVTAMAFIATRAQPGRPILSSLILSATLAVLCAVIFVYGISLPISLWP